MYTCRTCKHLRYTRAKKTFSEGGAVHIESPTIIDALADWHCPWYWFSMKPIGESCEHWKNMNGKHWL